MLKDDQAFCVFMARNRLTFVPERLRLSKGQYKLTSAQKILSTDLATFHCTGSQGGCRFRQRKNHMTDTFKTFKTAMLSGAICLVVPMTASADYVTDQAVKGAVAGAAIAGVTGNSMVSGAVAGAAVGSVHDAVQKDKYEDAQDRAEDRCDDREGRRD